MASLYAKVSYNPIELRIIYATVGEPLGRFGIFAEWLIHLVRNLIGNFVSWTARNDWVALNQALTIKVPLDADASAAD
jgi:hypothetical protein